MESATNANDEWALGPGSVSWRVMRDPTVFILGQIRTSMLLMMHPPFATSAEHDTFMTDPVLRFRRVGMYAYTVIYGTKAEAARATQMVRARHGQVKGVEPITRRPYQSNSEYELALTQVIEKSSYLAIFEALYGPLPEKKRDRFYAEQRVAAAMLGINPDHLPNTNEGTERFLAEARKRFCVGERGREILAYYDNQPYPEGSVLGDLPFGLRQAALKGVRLVADMALGTIGEQDRFIIAVNRKPVLRSRRLTRGVMKAVSLWLTRTRLGEKFWAGYLQDRAYGIFADALVMEDSEPHAMPARPDPYKVYKPLPDLKRNWPGDVADYALGRPIEGEIDLHEGPVVNLRDSSQTLEEAFAAE